MRVVYFNNKKQHTKNRQLFVNLSHILKKKKNQKDRILCNQIIEWTIFDKLMYFFQNQKDNNFYV